MMLSFRVVKSRAWWGSCLPIGAFCKSGSPTTFWRALNTPLLWSSRSIGLPSQVPGQIQPKKPRPLCHRRVIYRLRARLVPRLQLHHLRSPYFLHRCRTLDRKPPEGSGDIRHQRCLHLLVTGVYHVLQLDICARRVLMESAVRKAGGSALQTNVKLMSTGQKIVLVGLVLQAVSYGFFCLLLIKSHISIKSHGTSPAHKPCVMLIWVLYFSSAFISVSPHPFYLKFRSLTPAQIRCIYRVIEFAQGYGGYLLTHEGGFSKL